ncbi:MAG: hypothetical protein ACI8Q1_002804 [Parvicella sp.]|jgi:hypothetical protein
MNIRTLLSFICFSIIQSNTFSQGFILEGVLTGFEDSTILKINPYLNNMDVVMDNEQFIYLKGGRFR